MGRGREGGVQNAKAWQAVSPAGVDSSPLPTWIDTLGWSNSETRKMLGKPRLGMTGKFRAGRREERKQRSL